MDGLSGPERKAYPGINQITADLQEAQRKLRERLQARDGRILDIVRKGKQLRFEDWVDLFLENYSRPSIRAEKTHQANERAAHHLKAAFGRTSMGDITADDIERYLRQRLQTLFRSRPAPVSSKETGLSRRPSIRNCES